MTSGAERLELARRGAAEAVVVALVARGAEEGIKYAVASFRERFPRASALAGTLPFP